MEKSYGVLVDVGGEHKICNIIFGNKKSICNTEEVFYIGRDNQERVEINVYETEGNEKYENVTSGTLIGKGILHLSGTLLKDSPFLLSLCLEKGRIRLRFSEDSWTTEKNVDIQLLDKA